MNKRKLDLVNDAGLLFAGLKQAVLITTKADNKVDTMTIGWGHIGIEWGKPIFITYIRTGRMTHDLLEKNPEFTINMPYGNDFNKQILNVAGTKSGRDINKIKLLNLTPVDSNNISVPGLKELPITLECRVIYKQDQIINEMPTDIKEKYYPDNVDSNFAGSNMDTHTAYYGEIIDMYVIEN